MSGTFTIFGAGVAGLCVATELVARGAEVTLVDPAGSPGAHGCSWWAGGMLAADCEGETAEEPVVRLGRRSAQWWADQGVALHHKGSLVVTLGRDRQELTRFARRTEGHRQIDAAELALLESDLAGRFERALLMENESHLDPRDALDTLHARLAAKGVNIVREAPPRGQVIDCRGLAARDQLSDLRGVKGEMVILRAPELDLKRPIRLLHPRFPLYIVPRGDGVYMLGATQIESGERSRATVRSVMELLNAAYALHPAFGEAELLEIGVDARPAFPDNVPRLTEQDGVLYVNGLFRHGYLMAPALARMAADYLTQGVTPELWKEVA